TRNAAHAWRSATTSCPPRAPDAGDLCPMLPTVARGGPDARTSRLADAALVVLLGLLALKLTFLASTVRAIWVGDATCYLLSGTDIPRHGLPDPQEGPLYSLWYLFLSRLPIDPLELTFVSGGVLAALLSVAFYVLLRHLGCSRPWSLACGFLLLTSD